jgi:hypothetical protein
MLGMSFPWQAISETLIVRFHPIWSDSFSPFFDSNLSAQELNSAGKQNFNFNVFIRSAYVQTISCSTEKSDLKICTYQSIQMIMLILKNEIMGSSKLPSC